MSLDIHPIAVTTGFTWTAAGAWSSCLVLLGIFVRQIVPWRKVRIDEFQAVIAAQAAEIKRFGERVTALETEMRDQRDRHEQIISLERASHEGELSLQRHATRNAKQILYGMLDLIEAAPDKAAAHAAKMRDRMKELDLIEATEAATFRGAKVIAASGDARKGVGEAA